MHADGGGGVLIKKYWSEVGLEPVMICNTVPLELDESLSNNDSDYLTRVIIKLTLYLY